MASEHEAALEETDRLLEKENVIIYEAAVCFESLFARIDILVKRGNELDLIEVKAKSYDEEESNFLTKNGNISTSWYPYLADAAFQKYILSRGLPDYSISAHLMLADKASRCSIDGLNQKFKLTRDNSGRTRVLTPPNLTGEELGSKILTQVNVDEYCELIYGQKFELPSGVFDFSGYVNLLAESYAGDKKICITPSAECRKCGKCCQPNPLNPDSPGIEVFKEEITAIAEFLHIPETAINNQSQMGKWVPHPFGWTNLSSTRWLPQPCPFYNQETKQCTVHSVRPVVCRIHPVIFTGEINSVSIKLYCDYGKDLLKKALQTSVQNNPDFQMIL